MHIHAPIVHINGSVTITEEENDSYVWKQNFLAWILDFKIHKHVY